MIKVTKWRPDTCGCAIEYAWDDTLSAEERILTYSINSKCSYHDTLDDQEAIDQVKKENTSKNKVQGYILENFADLTNEVQREDGTSYKELKAGVKYEWSFDKDRELVINLKGADEQKNRDIKSSVNSGLPDITVK